MTANQIAAAKAAEERRSNREREDLGRKEHKRQYAKDVADIQQKYDKMTQDMTLDVMNMAAGAFGSGKGKGKKSANDPAWYTPTDQSLRDVASFSFNTPMGSVVTAPSEIEGGVGYYDPLNPSDQSLTTFYPGNPDFGAPGIMTAEITLTPGKDWDKADQPGGESIHYCGYNPEAVAQAIYSFVRHANSGSKNYESVDMYMYIMAVSEVYAHLGDGMRMYGLARQYSSKNWYLNQLADALKWNGKDVRTNLANLRNGINTRIARFNQLCLPTVMPIIKRRIFAFTGVYEDQECAWKNPYYAFVPSDYHVWDIDTLGDFGDVGAGYLNAHNIEYNRTVEQYLSMLDEMLDALLKMEDVGIISGDILKAYGEGNLLRVSEISDDFAIKPIYDKLVLEQFRNLVVCPITYAYPGQCDIYQSGGKIHHILAIDKVKFNNSYTDVSASKIVLGKKPKRSIIRLNVEPSPEAVIEATRLTASDFKTLDAGHWAAGNYGTEVCTRVVFWRTDKNKAYGELASYIFDQEVANTDTGDVGNKNHYICSQFEYSPVIIWHTFGSDMTTDTINWLCDFDNYRIFTDEELRKLNVVALQGLYALPKLAMNK